MAKITFRGGPWDGIEIEAPAAVYDHGYGDHS